MDWPVTVVWMFSLMVAVSAQCDPITFVSFVNQHIIGGVLDGTALDLATCQNKCVEDASCFAVDVAQNPLRCYSLSNPTVSLQPESGVTHYRKSQTCRSGSTTCSYSGFSSYRFTAYYTEETQTSLDACAMSCIAKGSSCLGFSYYDQQNRCQLATSSLAFNEANLSRDVTWKTMKKGDCRTECQPFFAKKTDRSSPNGIRQQNVDSESGCKMACSENKNCVAFDLDRTVSPASCWIHESASNLDTERKTPGISQYVLVARCPTVPCQPQYTKQLNTNSPFGGLDSTLTTESSCKLGCAGDWYCLGFDFVPSPDGGGSAQCWLHRNVTNFSQKQTTSGVNQYTLINRCPQGSEIMETTTAAGGCTTTYYKKTDKSSPYGQLVDAVSTESDCKLACNANTACVAFDLDRTVSVPSCWLHMSAGDLKEQRNTPGISQYVKTTNCNTGSTTRIPSTTNQGCQIRWDSKPNTSSVGAVLQLEITTVQQCMDTCVNSVNCVAVDFNTVESPAQCWFHFDSNKLKTKRNDPGVTQYTLDRCYQLGCKIFWQNATATKSIGAMLQSGINTLEDCLNECIKLPSCVAVDYNFGTTPQQCWFHDDMNKVAKKVSDNNVNQYVLDRCYEGDTCQIRWENLTTTSSIGAKLQSGVVILNDCLTNCIKEPSCVAVDYNFRANPQECWFHDDMNKVKVKRYDANVNQYILDRCYKSPCPKFDEFRDQHVIGGIQQSQATTKDSCEQTCLNSMNCQGYDFDFIINGCYIFQMPKNANDLLTQNGTNHYELVCRAGETLPPTAMSTTTKPTGTTSRWRGTTPRNL